MCIFIIIDIACMCPCASIDYLQEKRSNIFFFFCPITFNYSCCKICEIYRCLVPTLVIMSKVLSYIWINTCVLYCTLLRFASYWGNWCQHTSCYRNWWWQLTNFGRLFGYETATMGSSGLVPDIGRVKDGSLFRTWFSWPQVFHFRLP